MIKFFTTNFELDLSLQKLTLIEENNFFHDSYYRNYSLPFSFKLNDELSKKLGFIDDFQSRKRTIKHVGLLQYGTKFDDAVLYLTTIGKKTIEGHFTFGKESIPLLDTPLKNLPFATVNVSNIYTHAASVISKTWPEVGYNFPMLIDLNIKTKSYYEAHEGFINKTDGSGNFIVNNYILEGSEYIYPNRNVLAPMVYIMEVLKVGFSSANIVMTGEFVNDKPNEKLLIYMGKYLEEFTENKLNISKNEFPLIDFIPDITFGAFLAKLKNWLNLEITFRKNIVTINYLENQFKKVPFENNSHLENDKVKAYTNTKRAYQLIYDDVTSVNIDSDNNIVDATKYEESELETVTMNLTVLTQNTLNSIATAEVLETNNDFKICIYNGLSGGYNIAPESIFGRTFSITEIKNRYWLKWISFRLNSLIFKDSYNVTEDSFDYELNIRSGQYKYENNHLFKKITRLYDNKKLTITTESETLL